MLLICSYIADLIFGDPEWLPHPVRGIGKLINFGEKVLWKRENKYRQRFKGFILAIMVIFITTISTCLFLTILQKINPVLGKFFWVYIGYTTISVKDLRIKAKEIYFSLKEVLLNKARKNLSKIVGRDTEDLNKEEVIKASIESIAENTNDGIIAPLFYLTIGGPILAITYKAINTLDSMLGYKNEKYINFGWASARIDDIANYIPARISGFLISLSSFILGKGFKDSFLTMLKQAKLHPSVNSGYPEASMAGSLKIKLAGPCYYEGKLFNKPYLGEDKKDIEESLIIEALNVSFVSSLIMLISGVIIRWLI